MMLDPRGRSWGPGQWCMMGRLQATRELNRTSVSTVRKRSRRRRKRRGRKCLIIKMASVTSALEEVL